MTRQERNVAACVCFGLFMISWPPVVRADEKTMPPIRPEAPEGWVCLPEDVWDVVPDTTGRHLYEARLALVCEHREQAALEIRTAASVTLFDGRRAKNAAVKQTLMDAVLDLEHLADHVEHSVVDSRTMMNHTFARVEFALARQDTSRLRDAWRSVQRDSHRIGHELLAAATHLDGGLLWAESPAQSTAVDNVALAMRLAEALERDRPCDGKHVQAAIEGVEKEVTRLGEIVRSFPPVATGGVASLPAVPLPAPDGYVMIEDDATHVNVEEPGRLLRRARADFANGNSSMAARDLREASIYVRIEGCRTHENELADALLSSVAELRTLADDAERGEEISAVQFGRLFAIVHDHLALANQRAAEEASAKHDARVARRALGAAITNLKQSLTWSGHETEAAAVELSRRLELFCARVARATGCETPELEEAVALMGIEARRLERRL